MSCPVIFLDTSGNKTDKDHVIAILFLKDITLWSKIETYIDHIIDSIRKNSSITKDPPLHAKELFAGRKGYGRSVWCKISTDLKRNFISSIIDLLECLLDSNEALLKIASFKKGEEHLCIDRIIDDTLREIPNKDFNRVLIIVDDHSIVDYVITSLRKRIETLRICVLTRYRRGDVGNEIGSLFIVDLIAYLFRRYLNNNLPDIARERFITFIEKRLRT